MRAYAEPDCASYRLELWADCRKQAQMKRLRKGVTALKSAQARSKVRERNRRV